MREVEAYQTADGQLFSCEARARAHEDDLIGETIDELLTLAINGNERTAGNVTRTDQYQMALTLLRERRLVLPIVRKLTEYLSEENNDD